VFFVLHNYMQYYGLVPGAVPRPCSAPSNLFSWVLFGDVAAKQEYNRSLLIVTATGILALFYGVFKDFISGTLHMPLLAKYTVFYGGAGRGK